jgi:hypothetical protein
MPTVDRNPTKDRERVALLWPKLDPALKLILFDRPAPLRVSAMQRDHITIDGF